MAGNYDPLHDVALTLAAVIHAVVTSTTLDVEALPDWRDLHGGEGAEHG